MPYPKNEIIEKTLAGIAKAQEDYKNWSGGCGLWEASEYMITVSIAKQVSNLVNQSIYVTLEHNVKDGMRAAGGMKGRPPKRLTPKGAKFDILLWRDYTPIGVVEVKKSPQGFANIKDDVDRICKVLEKETEIQFGLSAYFTSRLRSETKSAVEFVSCRISRIEESAEQFVVERGLGFHPHRSKIKTFRYDDDYRCAWAAAVLEISR